MSRRSFDYVVIGSGSAGCVIASRLSENPAARVLILEAGGGDETMLYRRPGMLAIVYQVPKLKERCDWGYRTTPQRYMNDRRMPWTRGKIVGGCSTVNGMLYIRGNHKNYDDWSAWGNRGWSFREVLPYFKKSENHEDGESEYHGAGGPLQVTRQQGNSVISEAYVEAISEVCGVPVLDDFNGQTQECAGIYQMTCRDRRRSSAAVAFLHPALASRPNLELVRGATVTSIDIERGRARAVRYVVNDEICVAHADAEIILSAGVIGSPQILMLSGVGPAAQLREHGIAVEADVPGVGENLHDHLMAPLRFLATKDTGHRSTPGHFFTGLFNEFVFQKGWFGKTFLEGGAFVKSKPSELVPDIQLLSIPWAYPEPNDDGPEPGKISTAYSFTMLPGLIYPKSRGTVRLSSPDPFAAPLIDPHYLEEPADLQLLVDAVRLVREIAHSKPLAGYLKGEATPGDHVRSDADIQAAIRLYGKTIYHPVGTCKMGVDPLAVVDPELRVRGVDGLRVADASIMPAIVGGNTNAPAIMIGEKAADLVRDYAARSQSPALSRNAASRAQA
jgi:choline dehydrogenase-like flavoprotein